jgi:hypothetical protein
MVRADVLQFGEALSVAGFDQTLHAELCMADQPCGFLQHVSQPIRIDTIDKFSYKNRSRYSCTGAQDRTRCASGLWQAAAGP